MTARVLVVDDLPANVKLLEARLNAEYFDVVTASNGPDAIKICEQGLCDLVLLDVMMPGMDGFEVCRILKGQIATAHLPIVLVTSLDQPADRVRGLDAGADDFPTKPIDEMALTARARPSAWRRCSRRIITFISSRTRTKRCSRRPKTISISSSSASA